MQTRLLLALALGLTLALGAAGCASPCQDLGYRVCSCEAQGQIATNCQTNVKARVRASAPTGAEQDYCKAILANCPDPNHDLNACAWMLNTCPGRVACGLAIATPGGGDGCTALVQPAASVSAAEADDL
jgi:hypothetical protein